METPGGFNPKQLGILEEVVGEMNKYHLLNDFAENFPACRDISELFAAISEDLPEADQTLAGKVTEWLRVFSDDRIKPFLFSADGNPHFALGIERGEP